jgi:hypothetical protein
LFLKWISTPASIAFYLLYRQTDIGRYKKISQSQLGNARILVAGIIHDRQNHFPVSRFMPLCGIP